ncbi:MAG: transcription elongation factor GreA [Bacteroidota bacterium]
MAAVSYMSQEAYDKFRAELEDLKSNGRLEAARAIAEAREKGDLSENAEYDAAKEAQGMLELKINTMEKTLANTRVLDPKDIDTSEVRVMTKVKIKNMKTKKVLTYHLVSEAESDLKQKKISVNSPVGKGLLGKKVGEVAEVSLPVGTVSFEVMNISV